MNTTCVAATPDSLELIRHFVRATAVEAGLERKKSYRLELAVDEIATNIVVHGYPDAGSAGEIVVRADADEEAVTIVLEDTATPFDPRQLKRPPQMDLPLAERPVGGLGVYLAIENVDEYRYEHVEGRNRNIFIMRRRAD